MTEEMPTPETWPPRRLREARLRELEPVMPSDDASVSLRLERARLLTELGRPADARQAYLEILALDQTHRDALNDLGTLLHEAGYRTAARTAYAQAVAKYPADPLSLVNLANALLENGQPAEARELYESALRTQPDHADAHRGLGSVLAELGDQAGATEHRRLGFGSEPVVELPYRGDGLPVPVLLLAGAAGGNIPLRHLLDNRVFQTFAVFPEYYDAAVPLPPHRLVLNAIGDADLSAEALAAAEFLIRLTDAPVINRPAAVAGTARGGIGGRLDRIPGLVTAGAVTLPREALADAEGAVSRNGFGFPLLIRTPGFHSGRHFLRVESAGELPAALAALPGDRLTVLRYLDARGADGKARKYRVMAIDGRLYPLHAAVSSDWMIHYFTAEMAESPEHRAEDAAFLDDMEGVLGPRAMAALEAIQSRLALDYGGIDFGLSAAGEVLLFEANATMVVNPPEPGEKWAYRRAAVERILAAVRKMLLERAGR